MSSLGASGDCRPTTVGDDADSYRELFEKALAGLGVADMEGNLLAFNDAILKPGAYTREDILRLGNVALLYARSADRERVLRIARERGFVRREKVQFRRKDGSTYDTLLTLTPVRFGGRPCWYATVEDITEQSRLEAERRQLEIQLQHAQKMEAVGRMTSGIAHDFKNLLLVIGVNAELLGGALDEQATEARRALDELHAAAARGAAMIEKLLGFSRKAPLSVVPTDLAKLMLNLRDTLRQILPDGIAVEITAPDECVAAVDPGAVRQILLNLATNARDAMEQGGVLSLQVRSVSLDAESPGGRPWMPAGEYARVTVCDTGTGMDDATRARVFEPFFTTKPVGVGTGLGLPMVFGLVKQQHGFIDLESVRGHGTTVHLHFRMAGAAPPDGGAEPSRRSRVPCGSETLLLIEDDHSLRDTTVRVLHHLGYRVLVAADGVEGVELYRRHRQEIRLVISDEAMPGLTGHEVYRVIRQENPEVPFLLSSGHQDPEVGQGSDSANPPRLHKPWTIGEMARRVRESLDRG